jgi:hypothetical protein
MNRARILAALLRRQYNLTVQQMDDMLLDGNVEVVQDNNATYLKGFLAAVESAENAVGLFWNGETYVAVA